MKKEKWCLATDKKFQKVWDLCKDDYSTEGYELRYVFEVYLPFWQVKQNVFVEKVMEDDRFTRILLQLIDNEINSHSGICSFLGIDEDCFCLMQLDFLRKKGFIKGEVDEGYRITHEGVSFLENNTKLTVLEETEFEFYMIETEKTTYLQNDLTKKLFDPKYPLDSERLSKEKNSNFSGYKVLETHKILEELKDNIQVKHGDKPTRRKLAKSMTEFAEFFKDQHKDNGMTFYDFADSEVESHKRNICFLAFLYCNKDNHEDVKIDIRQSENSVLKFDDKYEPERVMSRQVQEYVLKYVEFDFGKEERNDSNESKMQSNEIKYCHECGTKLKRIARFCTECGEKQLEESF